MKTVIIKIELEMAIEVNENSSPEIIEFSINEGTGCANNIIRRLYEQMERMEEDVNFGDCFCGNLKGAFIREASQEDIKHYCME